MKDIIQKIQSGELSRENDEKEAGGFWDLSREIALIQGIGYSEEMQEEIYDNLWLLYEDTRDGIVTQIKQQVQDFRNAKIDHPVKVEWNDALEQSARKLEALLVALNRKQIGA